jgi:PAS domain S-box-containing protein
VADALIFIDTQGVIRVWNARCEALFGFSAAEALGQSVDLIIPEHLRGAPARLRAGDGARRHPPRRRSAPRAPRTRTGAGCTWT